MSSTTQRTKQSMAESGILHSSGKYWVSNEGTSKKPNFHVWENGITHSTCDSAYNDLSLAIARCNYLSDNDRQKLLT